MPVKKNGGKSAKPVQTDVDIAQNDIAKCFNMPISPALFFVHEVLSAGNNILNLGDRNRKVNHGARYSAYISESNDIVISKENADKGITLNLELLGMAEEKPVSKVVKKAFALCMIKINEQAINGGGLIRDCVSFPLSEFVKYGIYSSLQNARRGYNDDISNVLTRVRLTSRITVSPQESYSCRRMVPFIDTFIKNGDVVLFLNKNMDWNVLCQYYTKLPVYAFSLPSRSYSLLFYVSFLARQNSAKLKKYGYFTISYRAIQAALNLPSEIGNKNPKITIIDEIEKAIECIENEQSKTLDGLDIGFLVDDTYNGTNITSFLDTAELKVYIKGEFAKELKTIQTNRQKRINASKSKAEKSKEQSRKTDT